MERQRRLAFARLSAAGNDPDVLHRAAAEHPAEVQLAARGGGAAVSAEAGPGDVPGADELAEQLQLLGVRARRAVDVQGFDEAVGGHRHSSDSSERRSARARTA